MEILKNPNFDFLGKTRYFVAASLLLILAGHRLHRDARASATASSSPGGTQLIAEVPEPPRDRPRPRRGRARWRRAR